MAFLYASVNLVGTDTHPADAKRVPLAFIKEMKYLHVSVRPFCRRLTVYILCNNLVCITISFNCSMIKP